MREQRTAAQCLSRRIGGRGKELGRTDIDHLDDHMCRRLSQSVHLPLKSGRPASSLRHSVPILLHGFCEFLRGPPYLNVEKAVRSNLQLSNPGGRVDLSRPLEPWGVAAQ